MGNDNNDSNTPPADLYAEIDKRKDWFFECQLRRLYLESFRDIEVNEQYFDPLLDLISEPAASAPLGSRPKEKARVYLDSHLGISRPVWTRGEREQRGNFKDFIGNLVNWLDYTIPTKLKENLNQLKIQFESVKFSSIIDNNKELNTYGRESPSFPADGQEPRDKNRLSHAISRMEICQKKPWLIPEVFNGHNIETTDPEKWIQNGETVISNFEREMNEVLGGNKALKEPFNLGEPDVYRAWVQDLLKDSLAKNSSDAIKVSFLDTSSEPWKFKIKIQTPASPSLIDLDNYSFSDGVKYWINTSINPLEEIFVNKADSDMGLCLVMRALYLYGTLPLNLGDGQKLRWRDRKPPTTSFYNFFAQKTKLIKDNPDLQDRILALETKLQILLEETAASEHSGSIHFSPLAQEIIKQDILGYKFWLDEPFNAYNNAGNPGNEKMLSYFNRAARDISKARTDVKRDGIDMFSEKEYWSENHYIMFASSEYLAGQLWKNETFQAAKDFLVPVTFLAPTQTGYVPFVYADKSVEITGELRMNRGKARVLKWLNNKLMFGWTEFNSSGYYREHLMALLNLVDFSLDEEVQRKATMVTDLLFFDLMRFSHKGAMGAAGGRSQFSSKSAGWDNALGDVVEIILGSRGMFVNREGDIACSFSTSTYKIPDVLLQIGNFPPALSHVDRSRVSITFEEASKYGIQYSKKSDQKDSIEQGFAPKREKYFAFLKGVNDEITRTHIGYGAKEDDTVFWWTLSAYFNKQVVKNTLELIETFGLRKTGVFDELFNQIKYLIPFIEKTSHGLLGAAIGSLTGAGAATLTGAALGFIFDDIFDYSIIEEGSNDLSTFLEGSTRTRVNILTYRNRDVMLSSLQNFRTGQFNFQSNVNQATLNTSINVFTTAAFAGVDLSSIETGLLGGVLVGAASGGFAGAILGAIGGFVANELAAQGESLLPAKHGDGPGWWTGYWALPMVVQHESAAILAYDYTGMQKALADVGSHLWFPKVGFAETEERRTSAYEDDNFVLSDISEIGPEGFWLFGKIVHRDNLLNPDANEEGYIGVFSNQSPDWQNKDSDFYKAQLKKQNIPLADFDLFAFSDYFAEKDWYVSGKNIWIIQVGNKDEFGSFDNFKDRVSKAKIVLDDEGDMECSYAIPGKDGSSQTLSLKYGDGGKFSLDGKPFETDLYPRFENLFIRGGWVEWGQREYIIEYNGKLLMHDFSNMGKPVRAEIDRNIPQAAETIKGLVIYLKTEGEELEVFTRATATVNIGCSVVAVDEVIAAGKVDENTFHDPEWIFFDMSAISNPDMTIDIGHHVIPGTDGDPDSEWKMTYTLSALMGDRSLKQCTVRPIPLGTFYLRGKVRNTGPVPFSVQLSQWRAWSVLGNTSGVKSWMIADQPGNDLFYFDYIDILSFDKDRILSHKKLGPCTAASLRTDLTGQDHELAVGEHYSLSPFSTRPGYLFLFLMNEGALYARWLFPNEPWSSRNWMKLNLSYQPMIQIPFTSTSKPDPSASPLPVPLGLRSHVRASFINYTSMTPSVYVSGADGNVYVTSQWPLDGFGNWRQIETVSSFALLSEVPFQVGGNFIFALDNKRSLWRYPITPGQEDTLDSWQQLPFNAFIIQSFTVATYDEHLQVIALTSEGEVWAIRLNLDMASARWQRVGVNINFRTSPEAQISCTSAITGRLDIFAPGTDGKLYTTWWTEQSEWENDHNWVAVAGESQKFEVSSKGNLAAISRVNGQIEVFATDVTQNIWKNWWS